MYKILCNNIINRSLSDDIKPDNAMYGIFYEYTNMAKYFKRPLSMDNGNKNNKLLDILFRIKSYAQCNLKTIKTLLI